ncbi:hypothetical protein IE53DRAFT_359880 [Violaceomyces palustris]|uniref:Uncharacterized protein n=1 Tax=Violaceomyces palustris TaxID=1673888 RepID=A0ACD0P690_9BASI|nr:hypothetical protein IE53DRAFT_359880 [Violaceomyces palustris]
MSEAGKLRERLRVLKQAVKCVEDSTLQTLPPLIKKWRKAGHEAARDLWTLGGGGEWDACPPSRHASFGSYHPENSEIIGEQPPSPLRSETETKLSALYKLKPRVRKRDRREDDEGGSNCEEWFGNGEDDQERLHPSKVSRVSSSNGTEGSSPPPLEELFKQARSCAKVKVYGGGGGNFTRPRSAAEYEDQGGDYEEAEPSSSTNAEHSSWNIGKMLDLIGVERSSLKWNEEEEDFDEEEEEEEEEERKRGMP